MTWTVPEGRRGTELGDLVVLPEREMLDGWLDWQRETLLGKCAGLGGEEGLGGVDAGCAERDFGRYRDEVAASRAAVAGRGLDETFVVPSGKRLSVRWVYVHMIQEYARHNGHADLLRERTDGRTGD